MRYAALPKAEQKLVLELQGWKMRNYIASKKSIIGPPLSLANAFRV